jgi:hypothetical protein
MRTPLGVGRSGLSRPSWPFTLNRQSPQAQGLVAWWPCVEAGAFTRDLSLGGWDLARTGVPWVAAPQAQTLSPDFNGTSDVLTRDDSPISGMPFTMAVWAVWDTATSKCLMSLSAGALTDRYQLQLDSPGDLQAFIIQGANSASAETAGFVNSAPEGTLFHAVGVYASSTSRSAFMNGVLGETDPTSIVPNACTQLTIGARRNTGSVGAYFDGRIIEARFYNRALTAAEVWNLYAPQSRWDLYRRNSRTLFFVTPPPPRVYIPKYLKVGSGLSRNEWNW